MGRIAHWCVFFFFKQKTAYEMRISDWSSDVCSSDLSARALSHFAQRGAHFGQGMGNGAMIAVKRLQSIFWVLLVTLGAIAVYLVSLRVATERTELARVDAQILSAKREISTFETEFSAQASMRARKSDV